MVAVPDCPMTRRALSHLTHQERGVSYERFRVMQVLSWAREEILPEWGVLTEYVPCWALRTHHTLLHHHSFYGKHLLTLFNKGKEGGKKFLLVWTLNEGVYDSTPVGPELKR